MKSIRFYLNVTMLTAISFISVVTIQQGYRNATKEAESLLDSHLEQYVQLLAVHALNDYLPNEPPLRLSNYRAELIYQLNDENGQLLSRSYNAPKLDKQISKEGYSVINHEGYEWHALTRLVPQKHIWITVAERADLRYQVAESLVLKSIKPIVFGLFLMALATYLIITVGLRPLQRLAQQLQHRRANYLEPIALDKIPKELQTLSATINELLSHLKQSFEREQRLAGDAAHELRTPIAALSVHLQNALHDREHATGAIHKAIKSAQRLEHIVQQILTLNRATADHYLARQRSVNLQHKVKVAIEAHISQIVQKHQEISFDGDSLEVLGDPIALEILVSNLLDNAIKYTPEGGKIEISLKTDHEHTILTISDTGCGVPHTEYSRLFDRFHRAGGNQYNPMVNGSGLGLSIVKQIADLHQAHIKVQPSLLASTGLSVSVCFARREQVAQVMDATH